MKEYKCNNSHLTPIEDEDGYQAQDHGGLASDEKILFREFIHQLARQKSSYDLHESQENHDHLT